MGRRDRRHGRGAFWRWFPVVVVLALLAGAGAAYRFDLGARWFDTAEPDPQTEPAAVPPPPGLTLPALSSPPAVAEATDGAGPSPAKIRKALQPLLGDKDVGRRLFAVVGDVEGNGHAFTWGDSTAIPASTTKLLTATAALEVLGPDATFETRVVSGSGRRIVLVGGGDPLLARAPQGDPGAWPHRADIVGLARQTAQALEDAGRKRVTLSYDDSLFSGPAVNPHWPNDYVPDGVVSPITSLWLDEGRAASGFGRVADPSATAAAEFAGLLGRFGVKVTGQPTPGHAASGADEVASVSSAPLSEIAEWVLTVSDNEGAEVLARQVGLAVSDEGSFEAGVDGVLRTLRRLGVDFDESTRLYDGSGLSRENRLSPDTLMDVLRTSADHPELDATLTGLPVAGFTGSLETRFADTPPNARGLVRAKTGTLTGVSSLAGTVTDQDGTTMVFALMADRVKLPNTLDAREAIDDAAAALAACHCSLAGG